MKLKDGFEHEIAFDPVPQAVQDELDQSKGDVVDIVASFDADAFYAKTDDEILAEPWTDEDWTVPTWKFETVDGVTTMVPGRPLNI